MLSFYLQNVICFNLHANNDANPIIKCSGQAKFQLVFGSILILLTDWYNLIVY